MEPGPNESGILAAKVLKEILILTECLAELPHIPIDELPHCLPGKKCQWELANKHCLPVHPEFDDQLSSWEEPNPEKWSNLLNYDKGFYGLDSLYELKAHMILDSAKAWREFQTAVFEHAVFIETDYTDEVCWQTGNGNLTPYESYRLYVLSELIERRINIDASRWILIKRYRTVVDDYDWENFGLMGTSGISMGGLDAKLKREFEHITQSIPTPGNAVPPRHDYARGEHFAHKISIESCQQLLASDFQENPPELVLTSSFMAAFHALLLGMCKFRTANDPYRIGVLGSRPPYIEVNELLRGSKDYPEMPNMVFGGRLRTYGIPSEKTPEKLDAIYYETGPSKPSGHSPNWDEAVAAAYKYSCDSIIVDTTLIPLALDKIKINKFSGIVVQLHSLAKFAQMGTNIAMGGLALIHKAETMSPSDKTLATTMRKFVKMLGQHPDPNLAKAICRNPDVLNNRMRRSCRNAKILRLLLSAQCPFDGTWSVSPGGNPPTPLVWIKVKASWEKRARELEPPCPPFGIVREESNANNPLKLIADILESSLWKIQMGEQEDECPAVRTSFGFNFTTFFILYLQEKPHVFIRISCGLDTVEVLREVATQIVRLLGRN